MHNITTPTADELPLIYDSWTKSYRKSPWAGTIPNNLFEQVQRACIQGVLVHGAHIVVALAPQVPGVFEGRRVMGWICYESSIEVVHYFYVKNDFRGQGIAKALIEHAASTWQKPRYTHRTRGSAILSKKWRWDTTPARVLSETK